MSGINDPHMLVLLAKRYFSTLQQEMISKLQWCSGGAGVGITSYVLQTQVQYKGRRLCHYLSHFHLWSQSWSPMAFTEHPHLFVFTLKQVNTPFVCWRFLSISSRGKNENKKQYTIEIEGAMVKRQLQTWINCIMSSVVTLFPASVPQWVRLD